MSPGRVGPLKINASQRTLIHVRGSGTRSFRVGVTGSWYLSFECSNDGGEATLDARFRHVGRIRQLLEHLHVRCGDERLGPGAESGPALLRVLAAPSQQWELLVQQAP